MVRHQPSNSLGNYNYGWHLYNDTGWAPHFHKNLEAVYVLEGQVEMTVAGKTCTVSQGQWGFVLSNQIHSYVKKEHHKMWIVVFSEDFVPQFSLQTSDKQCECPVFCCTENVQNLIQSQIMNSKDTPLLMKKAGLYALCSEFLSAVTLVPRDFGSEDRLERLLEYIAGHYTDELTLKGLAEQFGYEYHYLSRLLHKNYRISFRDLLNQYRVDEALRLLRKTRLPITQIALQCGFSNIRSFNYVFRQMTGHTPRQERDGIQ